jgi:predicted glycoside hydrolase/deacetylase ChbG (UPF0249 family)
LISSDTAIMETLLITRGDDLGSFPEANLAIIDCHKQGILRNASVMTPCPAFAQGAELALTCPELCLGLHITLTSEWEGVRWGPVSDPARVPSLIDADGHFLTEPKALMERGIQLEEIMREVRAQLAKARRHGLPIRYLDEHMFFGWIHAMPSGPPVYDAMSALAREEGLIWHRDAIDESLRHFHERIGFPPTVSSVTGAVEGLELGEWLWITHPARSGGYLERSWLRHDGQQTSGQEGVARVQDALLLSAPSTLNACIRAGVRPASYPEAIAQRARHYVRLHPI